MIVDSLPNYSVRELNKAIGNLLERGFAPRFILHASITKSQLKKGHLWLTLTDGQASISAVVWSSQFKKLHFSPNEGDGVLIVGKLNFWETRASLVVQVLDIRPSISTVLRKFEVVKAKLLKEGLLDESKQRVLPRYPKCIAILTSVPSSALADMLRTAKERWPLTKLLIIAIPVQGAVSKEIQSVLNYLEKGQQKLGFEAIVLARGGGSREDLMLFDDEDLCRQLAVFPVPVVTGIGHEDDLTVADLIADYRAATPTASMIAILPSQEMAKENCFQRREKLNDHFALFLRKERQSLLVKENFLHSQGPLALMKQRRQVLDQKAHLLNALSPERWLLRGFSIVRNSLDRPIRSIQDISEKEKLIIQLSDGRIDSVVDKIHR